MENPWAKKTEAVADERPGQDDSTDVGKDAEGGGGEDTGVVEGGVHPLFADSSDAEEAAADIFTPEGGVSAEEIVEGEKGVKLMKVETFEKRLGKVISQREIAVEEAKGSKAALVIAEAARDEAKNTLATFRAAYAQNPALAVWDAKFMESLEKLAKTDAELQPLIKKVQADMESAGGADSSLRGGPPMAKEIPDTTEKTGVVENSATLQRIIENQARTTVESALTGLKPAFIKILADHIVGTSEKLEGLTVADVVSMSRAYVADKGLDKADMLAAKPKPKDEDPDSGGGKTDKPSTGRSGKAATGSPTGKKGANEEGPPEPKSLDEWTANHNKRLAAFDETA
jgi:hypothetical protein